MRFELVQLWATLVSSPHTGLLWTLVENDQPSTTGVLGVVLWPMNCLLILETVLRLESRNMSK